MRSQKNQMEAEEILKLFDFVWFERRIFTHQHEVPSSAARFEHQRVDKNEETIICGVQNIRIRSLSDRCLGLNTEAAQLRSSVIIKPRLEKISSGKEFTAFSREFEQEKLEKSRIKKQYSSRKRGRKGISRSLSALEFEELKGFMDLGFVFNEEDKNPGLVSIIPGLQKWGKMTDDDDDEKAEVKGEISRPYLSEAWGALNKKRGEINSLMNWKIPSGQNEIIMKDHLKIWARTVASTVIR